MEKKREVVENQSYGAYTLKNIIDVKQLEYIYPDEEHFGTIPDTELWALYQSRPISHGKYKGEYLNEQDYALLTLISDRSGNGGQWCTWGRKLMACYLGVHPNTITRRMQKLIGADLIIHEETRVYHKGGKNYSIFWKTKVVPEVCKGHCSPEEYHELNEILKKRMEKYQDPNEEEIEGNPIIITVPKNPAQWKVGKNIFSTAEEYIEFNKMLYDDDQIAERGILINYEE